MGIKRIEIVPRFKTSAGLDALKKIPGLDKLERIFTCSVYTVESQTDLSLQTLSKVFEDKVLNRMVDCCEEAAREYDYVCEVSYKAGVTDNSALSAVEGLRLLEVDAKVASGKLYYIKGDVDKDRLEKIACRQLGNPLIQNISFYRTEEFLSLNRFQNPRLPSVAINHQISAIEIDMMVSDQDLLNLSNERCLALNLDELKHIQSYYKNLGRNPTDVELEVLAQTWSEHCKHKIFSAKIDFEGEEVNSLYKSYIKETTQKIARERNLDWLISVFHDNAGVVRFDENVDLCIKVETHNSPSALDPYGGAITGILGVNRDILGVGMAGFPIANTDVFCFADPSTKGLPTELKKPAIIMDGVHQGVEDGGNKSGIPTVNGAFYFDKSYAGKPLVFVGTVGVVPQKLNNGQEGSVKKPNVGDYVVMIGGAIGCDGIHGATFSSMELNENSPVSAVQIGDPLMQKRATDFLKVAQEQLLYSAITDNGAGGLSSSVGEMATMTGGARVHLDRCPVKYPGLSPYELFISESQERMTLAVPKSDWEKFNALAERMGVVATNIGEFTQSGRLEIFYNDQNVADLELHFMHDSLPQMNLKASWSSRELPALASNNLNYNQATLALLSSLNICSKESYVRRYDHEVGAATVIKPFVGKDGQGPSDCGAVWLYPHGGQKENCAVVGCGLNPRLSQYSPDIMAKAAVDEAVRNVVVSGGDIDHCCLVDNFCWPDPVKSSSNPDGDYKLGQLVKTCQGLSEICQSYGTPLVSGKDSMKNDYRGKDADGKSLTISVLPTLLVSAMAQAKTEHLVSSDFKNEGDLIYMVGKMEPGLLGSEYQQLLGLNDTSLFDVDDRANVSTYRSYYQACQKNLIRSGHDISDGGLVVALCESALGAGLGAVVEIKEDSDLMFGESTGRFVVSVAPENKERFEAIFEHSHLLGQVTNNSRVRITADGSSLIDLSLEEIVQAWKEPLHD